MLYTQKPIFFYNFAGWVFNILMVFEIKCKLLDLKHFDLYVSQ